MSNSPSIIEDNPWGNLEDQDFRPPKVRISQGENAKNKGLYVFSNGRDAQTLFEGASLIVPTKGRVLYGPGKNDKSICGSSNFHTPDERYEPKMSDTCDHCPMSQWGHNEQKAAYKKQSAYYKDTDKPACKEAINLIMVDGGGIPMIVSFGGVAIKETKNNLFSRIRSQFPGVPPYLVKFDMGLTPGNGTDKDSATYFIPTFSNFSNVSEEEAERNKAMYLSMSRSASRVVSDVHEEMDNSKDEVPF